MRRTLMGLFVGTTLTMIVGCAETTPGETDVPNMMPHVMEALKIPGATERDQAVAKACRESADEKAWPAVLMGIQRIEDKTLRDEVAEECARTLYDLGKKEAAEEVAKLIVNQEKQDQVISELTGS